nr:ribonuclease H-like domain-containing protein [Tanacetum cinerariifolium]
DNPHQILKGKGTIDSGCSRHMTGNKAYLLDYQDFNGSPIAFGGSKGQITSKGKIKTGKLDFEDVYFMKELQHFNLFFVSQMCDKKNKVLFTNIECLVLSPDFQMLDENQVLLRVLKIRTGKLDFDDVYFVKELKFSIFSVSQMCDKNNSVLFTDIECLVLSADFKLPDESQVLLRVPRENNMYNVNLKNIVPSEDLTY